MRRGPGMSTMPSRRESALHSGVSASDSPSEQRNIPQYGHAAATALNAEAHTLEIASA